MTFALARVSAVAGAIAVGQIDTFEDGTTDSWANGGPPGEQPLNIASGGPGGAGDRFLEIQSGIFGGAERLIAFNRDQWIGDFLHAGVNEIDADLLNLCDQTLSIRIAMRLGTGGRGTPGYASTIPISLPTDGQWHHATFMLDADHLTAIGGPPDLATFLTEVAEFRLLESPFPLLIGDGIDGQFGADNIRALGLPAPEPSSAAAALFGVASLAAAALWGRRNPQPLRRR
jgi:hypothetical protein